ncbi:MAG: hypothetical protein MI806_30925, partial [Minwuiales bacterium]|nr:hypothetical protein [Minwuiales bacterium]
CIYCNVCKQLDEKFKEVHCFLWPKGARQAPPDDPNGKNPQWGPDGAALAATVEGGQIKLSWNRPPTGGIIGFDVYRAEDDEAAVVAEAVKSNKYVDRLVLGGLTYRYYVRAFDANGRASPPSNTVTVDMPLPETVIATQKETTRV